VSSRAHKSGLMITVIWWPFRTRVADWSTQLYANEAMNLKRYKTEMDRLRARIKELDGIARDLDKRSE